MAKSSDVELNAVKRVMTALVRMPPKPHEDMKLGKPRGKKAKSHSLRYDGTLIAAIAQWRRWLKELIEEPGALLLE